MICQCCGSEKMDSVEGNFYAGYKVQYVYHPGFGIQIMNCADCGFSSVEFVHPESLNTYYNLQLRRWGCGLEPGRRQLDAIISRGQSDLWNSIIGKGPSNILFYSAGRGIHASNYAVNENIVHIRELFTGLHTEIKTGSTVKILLADEDALCKAGTYDAVVLSNAFERLPFPMFRLSWFSHLLRSGGLLFGESPITDPETIRAGIYAHEEVNFFSTDCFSSLISREGSFAIDDATLAENPDGRKSIRFVLKNDNRKAEKPGFSMSTTELIDALGRVNFACFNLVTNVGLSAVSKPNRQIEDGS